MMAISLHQPWASLVFGLEVNHPHNSVKTMTIKRLETRSWYTHHRGPLAIHAAKTIDLHFCHRHGIDPAPLPRGAVIGVVQMLDCMRMTDKWIREQVSWEESLWGNFREGRYAWIFHEPTPWAAPLWITGRQGFFHITS